MARRSGFRTVEPAILGPLSETFTLFVNTLVSCDEAFNQRTR